MIPDEFDLFESPKLLVESAKIRITNLEAMVAAAISAHTYTVLRKHDNHSGDDVITLRYGKRLPPALRLEASAAMIDLRHSLDQAICDACRMLGVKKVNQISFPFCKDVSEFNGQIKRACGGVPDEIVDIIRTFQPYLGGDSLLWAVSKLASTGKHQRLVNVVPLSNGWILDGTSPLYIDGAKTIGINKMSHLRNELEFARINRGSEFQMNIIVTFEIVIGEADVVCGEPVLAVLDTFASKVEGIVMALESEARRLASQTQP